MFVKRNTMPRIILYLLLIFFSSCGSVKYYIVRHAEKETAAAGTTMNTPNDPPLSAAGRVRAIELKEALKDKGITYIFSTNTIRTITTAQPLDELKGATKIELYNTRDSLDFLIQKLKGIKKGNSSIVRCIKKFPLVNCSLDGDKIIIKKDINIGMATALPSGNLIVPVIKNADQLNLVGLAKQVNNLADNARTGKLKADDTTGGTFTLTNVGTFGSLMGTPIINQPQVAILAVGAIKKRPVVVETPAGDSIAIRHMMYLSMSYDHRIVDGSLGATFLTAVAKELENFNGAREY